MSSQREAGEYIRGIETELKDRPDDLELRKALLIAFAQEPELNCESGRVAQIVWHIRNVPEAKITGSPYCQVSVDCGNDVVRTLDVEWQAAVERHREDFVVLGHYARFLNAVAEGDRARVLLRTFIEGQQGHGEAWFELARADGNAPAETLSHLTRARELGFRHPFLVAWQAISAAAAKENALATGFALELQAGSGENDGYAQHIAETVLGLVSLRAGDTASALQRLRSAALVTPEHRLTAYGPSLLLATELAKLGFFKEVAEYLDACGRYYDNPIFKEWCTELHQRRVPEDFESE